MSQGFGTVTSFRNGFGVYPNVDKNGGGGGGGGGEAVVTDTEIPLFYPDAISAGTLTVHRIELAGRVFATLSFDITLPGLVGASGLALGWSANAALVGLGGPLAVVVMFCGADSMYALYTYYAAIEADGSGSGKIALVAGGDASTANARQTFSLNW